MIVFWLICAVLVAIALAFVLPPLLAREHVEVERELGRKEANIAVYRDQIAELSKDLKNGITSPEQYQQDRDELERRLLDDISSPAHRRANQFKAKEASRGPAYALALGLPITAVAIYLIVGQPKSISTPTTSTLAATENGSRVGQMSSQQIEANVASLAARLRQNPADTQGWIMLGRSYSALEKYNEAAEAYGRATASKTDDADLWADFAFAAAMANGRQLQGKPMEYVERALKLDAQNPKALELAGSAAFQARNYNQAIEYWQKLMNRTARESDVGQAVAQRIAEAKRLARTADEDNK